jgi:hypothetical protein
MRENKCNLCVFKDLQGNRYPCRECQKIVGKRGTDKFKEDAENVSE